MNEVTGAAFRWLLPGKDRLFGRLMAGEGSRRGVPAGRAAVALTPGPPLADPPGIPKIMPSRLEIGLALPIISSHAGGVLTACLALA